MRKMKVYQFYFHIMWFSLHFPAFFERLLFREKNQSIQYRIELNYLSSICLSSSSLSSSGSFSRHSGQTFACFSQFSQQDLWKTCAQPYDSPSLITRSLRQSFSISLSSTKLKKGFSTEVNLTTTSVSYMTPRQTIAYNLFLPWWENFADPPLCPYFSPTFHVVYPKWPLLRYKCIRKANLASLLMCHIRHTNVLKMCHIWHTCGR